MKHKRRKSRLMAKNYLLYHRMGRDLSINEILIVLIILNPCYNPMRRFGKYDCQDRLSNLKLFNFNFRGRERREKEEGELLFAGSHPKCLQQLRLAKPELGTGDSVLVVTTQLLEPSAAASQGELTGKLGVGLEAGLELRYFDVRWLTSYVRCKVAQWSKPPTMPASYLSRVPFLAAPVLFQLPAHEPRRAGKDGPSAQAPKPMWMTRKKLLTPGFSLTQPWPLWPFGERINGWIISLPLCVSPSLSLRSSAFQIRKHL